MHDLPEVAYASHWTVCGKRHGRGRMTMERGISREPKRTKAEFSGHQKPCPPHGPILIQAVDKRAYVASCLACGLEGAGAWRMGGKRSWPSTKPSAHLLSR